MHALPCSSKCAGRSPAHTKIADAQKEGKFTKKTLELMTDAVGDGTEYRDTSPADEQVRAAAGSVLHLQHQLRR